MYTFYDQFGCKVELSIGNEENESEAKHVFVICKYNDCWLVTNHKVRGLEFPGGKIEDEETPREAAVRETVEETGGVIGSLEYIGQYRVFGEELLIKNVYYAQIDELKQSNNYFETNGPLLLKQLPGDMKTDEKFSFIMKDEVVIHCLKYINEWKRRK